MRQNVGLDGGDGDGTQNNTSRRFQKRAGGKLSYKSANMKVKRSLFSIHYVQLHADQTYTRVILSLDIF